MKWRKGIADSVIEAVFGAEEEPKIGNGEVTLAELIRRKVCIISAGSKYYRVTVEQVELQVKASQVKP